MTRLDIVLEQFDTLAYIQIVYCTYLSPSSGNVS